MTADEIKRMTTAVERHMTARRAPSHNLRAWMVFCAQLLPLIPPSMSPTDVALRWDYFLCGWIARGQP